MFDILSLWCTVSTKMASVTATVLQTVTRTVSASASSISGADRATPQGGVFEGVNPTHWDSKSPITLFVIQACIVIAFTRILHWPLSKLRQPRVIAEVITVRRTYQDLLETVTNHSRVSSWVLQCLEEFLVSHSTFSRLLQCLHSTS